MGAEPRRGSRSSRDRLRPGTNGPGVAQSKVMPRPAGLARNRRSHGDRPAERPRRLREHGAAVPQGARPSEVRPWDWTA